MDQLVAMLGAWTTRRGPRYAQLAEALADANAEGALEPGARLPAERLLARRLGMSRGTVVAAYDVLRSRGLAHTRRGSGTVVTGEPAPQRVHRAAMLSRLVDRGAAPLDMAVAAAQDIDDLPDVSVSVAEAAAVMPAHGYAPLGAPQLRAALARHHTGKGLATTADDVIVTTGGQGALHLIAAGLLAPGDRVLVEAPTYAGAIEVFARAGARVDGIERDAQGPRCDELERALAQGRVRLLYLVPTSHNPTGSVMSEGRRREVARLAAAHGVTVIEDTVLEDLLFEGAAPPPLASMLDGVLTVGSMSKTVWGGLRVGWVRGPAHTVLRLGRVKAALDLGSPAAAQALALRFVDDLPALAAVRRDQGKERLGVLAGELAERLPEWSLSSPRGGWSLWVHLPRGSGDDLAQLALRRGVAITAGRSAAPGEGFAGHVRLSVGPPPELLREGVARLAEAWDELCGLPTGARSEPAFVV